MTLLGLGIIATGAALFLLWVLNLVRTGRLYVGYAVLAVMGTVAGLFVFGAKPLRRLTGGWLEYAFPATGLFMALTIFVAVALVYVLAQLTILSNRVAAIAQDLAIQNARRDRGVAEVEPTRRLEGVPTSGDVR